MNRFKPIFIFLAVGYWITLSALTLYYWYSVGINPPTIGMAFSSFLPIGFMGVLYVKKAPRTSPYQIFLTFSIFAGVALIGIGSIQLSLSIMLIYGLSFICWILYIFWYSTLSIKSSDVLVPGKTLPDLSFTTYNNEPFYCSSLLGKKVVYLFYRGNWCPVCMAQMKEVATKYKELRERGSEVLLISPQSHKNSKLLAKKLGVDFHFLTDDKNKMAQLLGIDHQNGVPLGPAISNYDSDTVLPTVIITDELGRIIFLDQTDNYRIRPEPNSLLEVLDTLAA